MRSTRATPQEPARAAVVAGRSYLLDNRRDSLAYPDTHRRDAQRGSASAHLMCERYDQPRARASKRMPKCYCAAINVEPFFVDLEIGVAGEDLRGESLVDFEQVDVADFQPGARQCLVRRGDGTPSHDFRTDARDSGRANLRERFQAERLRPLRAHQQDGCGAVAQLGGVTSSHLAIGLE